MWEIEIKSLSMQVTNEIMVDETKIFDELVFKFFYGMNKHIENKKELFEFVKANEVLMGKFEAKALYDQKISKFGKIKEFTLLKSDFDVGENTKDFLINLDWELNRWSSGLKFEYKFYRGLLMTGKKDEYLCFCHLNSKSRNLMVLELFYFHFDNNVPD